MLTDHRPTDSAAVRAALALALAIAIAITIASPRARAMDLVRVQTRTDEAVTAFGVSGAGVTIAILDRGIDWTHPDFIRPDGTTRIKWMLDMTGFNLCSSSNPAPTEYSESQINAALRGGPTIGFRDAVGHGTVTAGIAAGNGSAHAGGKYRGIAPQADLIIVKLASEGAPAHGGQPSEAAFVACIVDALDWLDGKIDLMGQPCVGLINSGTQWGPIDGTSAVSEKIDEVFGLDRPGRVYVSPSGDEGDVPTHAGADYDDSGETVVRMNKTSTANAFLSMWYTGDQPAEITVTFDNGTTAGPVGPGETLYRTGLVINQYEPGDEFYPWTSTSGDRAVKIQILGHLGGGSVRVRGLEPGTGHLDLYNGQIPYAVQFDDHLVAGRLIDYASTLSATVATAHVARSSYVDINGNPRFVGNEGSTGQRWQYASSGPTRDGRVHGVDVSAPGHNCFAAYGPDSWWASFPHRLIHDGDGWYGLAGATSGSAPIVVGAIALMLERNPQLTGEQVRSILRDTAVTDVQTGPTPNAEWGFGKLDVFAAVAAAQIPCPADLSDNGAVDMLDLQFLLAGWGTPNGDVDGDGIVGIQDLLELLAAWGPCP